jgi:ribosomal-protein-alanine N-acetyltransferase
MTHRGTVTLETERLILRRFEQIDADAMFRNWASDPEVMRYMHYKDATSVDDARELIRNFSDTVFAVVLKSTNEIIGHIEYGITDEEARVAELAYFFGKAWWYNRLCRRGVVGSDKICI